MTTHIFCPECRKLNDKWSGSCSQCVAKAAEAAKKSRYKSYSTPAPTRPRYCKICLTRVAPEQRLNKGRCEKCTPTLMDHLAEFTILSIQGLVALALGALWVYVVLWLMFLKPVMFGTGGTDGNEPPTAQEQWEESAEIERDRAAEDDGWNMPAPSASGCVWDPTMNDDWHDDYVCGGVRQYFLPNDDFVEPWEMEEAAAEWERRNL